MHIRQRAIRTAAVSAVVTATVLGAAVAGTAEAASPAGAERGKSDTPAAAQPVFLSGEELPPHPSSAWYEGGVTDGLPDVPMFCLENTLPAQGASHREFWTDLDTSARQVTIRTQTVREARTLVDRAEQAVRDCPAAHEDQYPGAEAELRDYGSVDVQEGAHVYGVDTAHPEGATDVHLFGIGRDGRTVTVVAWGQLGDFADAPADAFRTTTRTAVEKLRS